MTKLLPLLFLLVLAGCVSTDTMPLAKGIYRIDADGRGFGGSESKTRKTLLRKAALLTLEKGYSHFALVDGSSNSDVSYVGTTPIQANTTVNASLYGNSLYGNSNTTYSGGQPIYIPTASSSATVVMLNASDPRAPYALDAQEILKEVK